MALASRPKPRRSWRNEHGSEIKPRSFLQDRRERGWRSTVGLKGVMALTGGVLGVFVVAHMAGNLKFFEGAGAFDGYAGWLRRIGSPVLGPSWYLWAQRAVLLACAVAHV